MRSSSDEFDAKLDGLEWLWSFIDARYSSTRTTGHFKSQGPSQQT